MNTDTKAPAAWCFFGVDETHHWSLGELSVHVERIVTVYLTNRAEHTHCCELTPSHWCRSVEFSVHYKLDTPDAAREEIDELVRGANSLENDCYLHVRTVERHLQQRPEWHYVPETPDPEFYETENDVTDHLMERWHANPRF